MNKYIEKISELEKTLNKLKSNYSILNEEKKGLLKKEQQILEKKAQANAEFNKYSDFLKMPGNNSPKIQEERMTAFEKLKNLEIARQENRKEIYKLETKMTSLKSDIIKAKQYIKFCENTIISQVNKDYEKEEYENPVFISADQEWKEQHENEYTFDM